LWYLILGEGGLEDEGDDDDGDWRACHREIVNIALNVIKFKVSCVISYKGPRTL
jgi:hypothetical protein